MRKIYNPRKGRTCTIAIILLQVILSFTTFQKCVEALRHQAPNHQQKKQDQQLQDPFAKIKNWREWNYYQILGLLPENYYYPSIDDTNNNQQQQLGSVPPFELSTRRKRQAERSKIKGNDIKKAYRKQAQKWHPDKIAARKKKIELQKEREKNSSSTDNTNKRQKSADSISYVEEDDNADFTVAECNKRFAKIAQAYEILNDSEKRQEYDLYLLEHEDQMEQDYMKEKRKEQQRKRAASMHAQGNMHAQTNLHAAHGATSADLFGSDATQQKRKSFFENFKTDPMAVFEEFFFGASSDDDEDVRGDGFGNGSGGNDDNFFDFFHDNNYNYHDGSREEYHGRHPDRTSEATQVRYDPRFGQEVHRVLHREEFHDPDRHQIYFRVIGQEFIEEFDRRYGHKIGFMPITEPYLVEEGYESLSPGDSMHRDYRTTRFPMEVTSSRLDQNDFISPETKFLRSDNKHYYAGLTKDCELVIIEDGGTLAEDVLIWTSGTFVPAQHQTEGCFLALYGSQLALMVGDVQDPHSMLWNSPDPNPLVPGSGKSEETVEYYASLDDDGSLAVYRRRYVNNKFHKNESATKSSSRTNPEKKEKFGILSSVTEWWTNLLKAAAAEENPPQTRAGAVWKSLQRWTASTFMSRPSTSSTQNEQEEGSRESPFTDNSNTIYRDECIYASGPAGCLTPGRAVIQISHNVKRTLGKTMAKMDSALEDFVESLSEGSEDDIDVLDTLIRVVGKTGNALGKGGMRMAQGGLNGAKKVIKTVKVTLQETFGRFMLEIDDGKR